MITGTARIWGYTDEIAQVTYLLKSFQRKVLSRRPDSTMRFEFGPPQVIGTRGFFTKRTVSQVIIDISCDNQKQADIIRDILNDLTLQMS